MAVRKGFLILPMVLVSAAAAVAALKRRRLAGALEGQRWSYLW